jgi:hypothetical protein
VLINRLLLPLLLLLLLLIAGVARSIESDVDNLMRLISIANILPKGMFVENAVKVCGGLLRCYRHCYL